MLLARSLLFDALFYGLMTVMGILLAPAAALSRRAALWSMKRFVAIAFWLLRNLCGLHVEIRGGVPQRPVLVIAKHQSFLDVLILTHALPQPRFVMKAELKWMPVLGFYAWRIGCTPVVRASGAKALRRLVSDVERTDLDGQVVIYPQGTRVAPGAKARYRPGAAVLYDRHGRVAVPVATNAGLFWGRRSLRRRPGRAVVEFLDPIAPGLPVPELMRRIEGRIEAASDALANEAERAQRP
ncbi:MAG: lysophospholipid acyltransferase family protein [Pseudomonadota bacterium]